VIRPRYFTSARSLSGGAAPEPLCHTVERIVRFEEVDLLGFVWHGRYASYFEDARVALGARYGFRYQDMRRHGFVAPIKRFHVDFEAPLSFDQQCRITAALFWNDAARLDFEYRIHSMEEVLLTQGYTVQLFLDLSGNLCLGKPDFYESFCQRWQKGLLGNADY
jgi:acyl-CoA thioester hydrolase